jgi:UPF0716 family protein affecting phage T7 exclusion
VGVTLVRGLLGSFGALLMLAGIALAAIPGAQTDLLSALIVFVPGAILVAGVLLERTRYRSLQAELSGDSHGPGGGETGQPDGRFRPTEERFVDPTTGLPMRVWVDPATGDQRYLAER